jgi:hypothetical protein
MYRKLADTITLDFTVHLPTTGAVSDADALPTVEIWEDETDTTLAGGTVTKRVAKTGNYRVAIIATTANGFEVGKSYNVVVTVIAGTVTAKAVIGSFFIDEKRLSDLNDITVAQILAGVVEGTTTFVQAVRLILSALTGKSSGIGTATVTVRDIGDTKNRIVATVDAPGNRTVVTRDGT